ncbi:CHAT domain-containing protein [Waterburya agarophytonicola K14]|uniref:CHAT domain-containing protein n=1 Tax=Waterburya agarophytonicola KI4 TaxID=2874699 RepID=A0A964FFZ6_9CYAN|nr:CHAT domain-containing protein [Waterburya agarophytonicola]MCC0175993.1 CHAT domain-containing protein [Waterburya agarophytonicola KI4]
MTINKIIIFIFSALLAVAFHLPAKSQTSRSSPALDLAIAAQQLYRTGKLSTAAITWQQAATAYQEQNDSLGRTKSSINQAQVLQDLGLYPKACDTLLAVFGVNNPDCDREQINQLMEDFEGKNQLSTIQGIGLRSLAEVLKHQGKLEESARLLSLSERATQNTPEFGATLLALGNVEQALANRSRDRDRYDKITEIIDRQDPQLALEPYQKTFLAYTKVTADNRASPIVRVQAQLNYLHLLIEIEDWWKTQTKRRIETWQRQQETKLIEAANRFSELLEFRLTKIRASTIIAIDGYWHQIPPSHQSIYARINYSRSLAALGKSQRVKSILQTALTQAKTIDYPLGESYALGYLGQYYGQQQQLDKAIALTNQALILAQEQGVVNDAREVTYLWQSQLGQLLEQQGKISAAIPAYTSAFNTLQSLRTDLNANNRVVQFDFRQEVKPVYLRLANLLLQSDHPQAINSFELVATKTDSNPNLELARQVIESLQLAELDNFFQDPCSETADTTIIIDRLDDQAAVIYPIVLGDRLEILLSLPNQPLQRFTTRVSETTLNQTIDLLYDSLYNPSVNKSAVNIFSTTPLDPQEITANMQTLLPILQDIYSWLIEPLNPSLTANQVRTLVFVLNGNLQNVPISALYDGKQYLLEKYGVALAPSLQLLEPQTIARDKTKVLAAGLSEQVEIQGNIFPALANVPQELNRIKDIFPQSHKLLNQEFTTASIKKQLEAGFSVVHLATHGIFSSNPDETFIITGDGEKIGIETLSNLLNSSSIHPELVVLSACDTAVGDDRAILGLAGVAVRSGTSSTIASLWSVDDSSTAQLMSKFYQEFEDPAAKKVDALQKAQLSLIDSLRQDPPSPALNNLPPHPYYWSPYVLVGNWQ